jgi:hypothetical protein
LRFDVINKDKEKEIKNLQKISSLTIIKYIETSIEIMVDLKAEEFLKEKLKKRKKERINNSSITENEENEINQYIQYEKLLRKYEADIRNFIKVK